LPNWLKATLHHWTALRLKLGLWWEQKRQTEIPARLPVFTPGKTSAEFLLLVVLPITAMIVAFLANIFVKDVYTAHAKLLIPFGREYTYRPIIGDGSNLAPWRPEVAINAELEILNADSLKLAVIEKLGPAVVMGDPEFEHPVDPNSLKEGIKSFLRFLGLKSPRISPNEKALLKFRQSFEVTGVKDSNVIHLNYNHTQRDAAVEILKNHLGAYMEQRIGLFGPPSGDVLESVLKDREQDAENAQVALENYKKRFDITQIESELRNAFEQELQIRLQVLQTEVALTQAEGKESTEDPLSALSSDAVAELRATISGLAKAKTELQNKLKSAQDKIRNLEGHKAEVERLEAELQSARRQLQSIRDKVDEMRLERALTDARWSNVRVIEPPHALEIPPGPSPFMRILIAGFLALIAGAGLLIGQSMIRWRVVDHGGDKAQKTGH
jgi:uncharacterized protein involved in exopolysaccharide biosynthesis